MSTRNFQVWFFVRRLLAAVVIVLFANYSIWFQLSSNLALSLADVWIKSHLSPYQDKFDGIIDKFNDYIVLNLSILLFLFTDFVLDPKTRYLTGWLYIGMVGLMITVNLAQMVRKLY